MQSDRLLSLLFLLEARGRTSARSLAEELEVSRRTIYRDVEALSAAGVPVYAERGRNGGCALLPGYRTDVTGLTAPEARALFVFAGRGATAGLGLEADLRSAMRKLLATLPEPHRPEAVRAQERVVIDPHGWMRGADDSPHLVAIQDAIWRDRRLRIAYRSADAGAARESVVDPYGLVAKAGIWYLIAAIAGEARLYRTSRVEAAEVLDEPADRPPNLDLEALWTELRRRFEDRGSGFEVLVRVRPDILPLFRRMTASRAAELPVDGETKAPAPAASAGGGGTRSAWPLVRLRYPAEGAAVASLLGFGADVEAIGPPALRESILRAAREVETLYA